MIFSQKGAILNTYTVVAGIVLIVLVGVIYVVDPVARWRHMQDAERIESFRQIQQALENYYDDFGRYPASSSKYLIVDPQTKRGVEWGKQWLPYLSTIPKDPERTKHFVYYSSPESNNQSYGLYASFSYPFENGVTCSARDDNSCARLPVDALCGDGHVCNSGVSSPNTSP